MSSIEALTMVEGREYMGLLDGLPSATTGAMLVASANLFFFSESSKRSVR
jgi:hypothetical protein